MDKNYLELANRLGVLDESTVVVSMLDSIDDKILTCENFNDLRELQELREKLLEYRDK